MYSAWLTLFCPATYICTDVGHHCFQYWLGYLFSAQQLVMSATCQLDPYNDIDIWQKKNFL